MIFTNNKNLKAPLSMLLMLLMLIQPMGMSLVMTGSDTPAHHTADMPDHMQFNHAADPEQIPQSDKHIMQDCCATAACCLAATNSGMQKTLAAKAAAQFEFRVSFQAIILPIEIKPPRQA